MAMGSLEDPGLARRKRALVTVRTTGLGQAITGRSRREGAQRVIIAWDHDPRRRAEHALVPGVRFLAADAAEPDAVTSPGPPQRSIRTAQTSW
jgi:NAD(P)-dependent dehydrogenase (short-subunit alcohol dehydrogenase family)